MILEDDDSIFVVDWGCAGLYPRFFEIASLSCLNPYDGSYEIPLIPAVTELIGLTTQEKEAMGLLQISRAASLRFML